LSAGNNVSSMPRSDEKTRAWLDALEREAHEHPRRHFLRLASLALLGYLYPFGLAAVSFAVAVLLLSLAPMAWDASDLRVVILYAFALLASLVLVTTVLSTLWVKMRPPPGHALQPGEALPLRAMADEVSKAAGAPRVHAIHVDEQLNAGVYQFPRFGFWGPRKNYLVVGLPLLASTTPAQFRAVLAHEVAHLKGRHTTFGSWVYRIYRTWDALARPLRSAGWLRWIVIGWFVKWFGGYFGHATLALRRRHEYDADRRTADVAGTRETGETLAGIDWTGYRLSAEFWPALFRTAGQEPLPPSDMLDRLARFIFDAPTSGLLDRWHEDERRRRTPITSDHPCLLDRLTSLGCADVLNGSSTSPVLPKSVEESAAGLLGENRARTWAIANASWKAIVIDKWRYQHGYARYLREKAEKRAKGDSSEISPSETPAEREWEMLQPSVQFASPGDAIDTLRDFLAKFPAHGDAAFTLARLLLERGEEAEAVKWFEEAMRHDSSVVAPSLGILLEHYRDAGRDREADPIRERLLAHERAAQQAQRERLKVTRRDKFLPHDLPPAEVEKIRRIVARFPQVAAARLVRKQVTLFADQRSYVLAIDRHFGSLEQGRAMQKHLLEGLRSQVPLPCAVVVMGWTSFGLRRRVMKACPAPVFADRAH
jgi:Zn-dependent protease with chaperone function